MVFAVVLGHHCKGRSTLPGDGVTGAGVTGDGVTGGRVLVISPPSHSTTGLFLGSAVPLHQHLQSFPIKPSPGHVLLGQWATMFVLVGFNLVLSL